MLDNYREQIICIPIPNFNIIKQYFYLNLSKSHDIQYNMYCYKSNIIMVNDGSFDIAYYLKFLLLTDTFYFLNSKCREYFISLWLITILYVFIYTLNPFIC